MLYFARSDPWASHSTARGPIPSIGLIKDARIHSEGTSRRINAYSHFSLTFAVDRPFQQVRLALEPNTDIIDHAVKIDYMGSDGRIVSSETINRHQEKVFKGTSWVLTEDGWEFAGYARIYVYRDGEDPLFDGAFTLFGDDHHVQLRSGYMSTKHELDPHVDGDEEFMVVVRDSDINEGIRAQHKRGVQIERSCTADDLAFNTDPNHKIRRQLANAAVRRDVSWNPLGSASVFGKMKAKRQLDSSSAGGFGGGINLRTVIGSTNGCPTTRKVALMGLVADCEYVASFGNNGERVRQNIISVVNQASTLYETTFNITLGLANLIVSNPNETCPVTPPATAPWNVRCNSNATIEDRLNIFSQWRGGKSGDGLAFWTQFTNCPTGASVGLAWLGLLCQSQANAQGSNFVSGANVVARTAQEFKVLAHEIGHTFGAVHDCTSAACADAAYVAASQCCPLSQNTCDANGQYIMNPSTGDQISQFSPCTVGNICTGLGRGTVNMTCLTSNRNVPTITDGVCGNGIVEEGEECDSGSGVQSSCCDPQTCRFRSGAVCDPANDECCTAQCGFAPNTQVCRPSNGPCDPQETCTGNTATCPIDVTTPDGQSCSNGTASGLYCASGHCTSRDAQCRSLVGVLQGVGNDTRSCDDTSCQLTCTSPRLGQGVCYGMQQWYVDGTKCGSGVCRSGSCVGNNVLNDVRGWIQRHLPLVIGLSAGIGGLIVLSILWCCVRSCMRRMKRKKMRAHPPIFIPPQDMGYVAPPYAPPPPPQGGGRRGSRRGSSATRAGPMSPGGQNTMGYDQQYYMEQAAALDYYNNMRDNGGHGGHGNNGGYAGVYNGYNNPPAYDAPMPPPPQRGQSARYA
ncbi:p45K [Drechslerella dactyloides]|uniref:Disintegrin and metalloproteinase domain-containing protein B n=1 Tax=Drechslerella dactyloides TaxID=74499 RepID=A0AAD6IXE8_DREDA|nr:p45K [Drechslerella dactyloides]